MSVMSVIGGEVCIDNEYGSSGTPWARGRSGDDKLPDVRGIALQELQIADLASKECTCDFGAWGDTGMSHRCQMHMWAMRGAHSRAHQMRAQDSEDRWELTKAFLTLMHALGVGQAQESRVRDVLYEEERALASLTPEDAAVLGVSRDATIARLPVRSRIALLGIRWPHYAPRGMRRFATVLMGRPFSVPPGKLAPVWGSIAALTEGVTTT